MLADGRVATCTQSKTVIEDNGSVETRNDGDLFWALRGGGGGTFGVVVYYVLKLHPAPNTFVSAVIRGSLYKNASDAHILEQGKKAYDEWVRTAPSHWGGSFGFRSGSIASWLFKFGPWEGETESELRPFLEFQARYHQQFNFFLTNVTSAAGYGVLHGKETRDHSASFPF